MHTRLARSFRQCGGIAYWFGFVDVGDDILGVRRFGVQGHDGRGGRVGHRRGDVCSSEVSACAAHVERSQVCVGVDDGRAGEQLQEVAPVHGVDASVECLLVLASDAHAIDKDGDGAVDAVGKFAVACLYVLPKVVAAKAWHAARDAEDFGLEVADVGCCDVFHTFNGLR